jgi:hypothetical protein
MGKDANLAVKPEHVWREVLLHDRRLVARLDEQISRKQTVRRLIKEHHRIPMVNMGRFEKPQPMTAKLKHVAIVHSLDRAVITPVIEVDAGAPLRLPPIPIVGPRQGSDPFPPHSSASKWPRIT